MTFSLAFIISSLGGTLICCTLLFLMQLIVNVKSAEAVRLIMAAEMFDP